MIIIQQIIEIDPYDLHNDYYSYYIDSDEDNCYSDLYFIAEKLVNSGMFGEDAKKEFDNLSEFSERVFTEKYLSNENIKFKRDLITGDNNLYSYKEFINLQILNLNSYPIYPYELDRAIGELSYDQIVEVYSSNNPLISIIAKCITTSNKLNQILRKHEENGVIDKEFLRSKGVII